MPSPRWNNSDLRLYSDSALCRSVYVNCDQDESNVQIRDIAGIKRTGPLIDPENNADDRLAQLALKANNIEVSHSEYVAKSASCAAAWLLAVADANAIGNAIFGRTIKIAPSPFEVNQLLGFRGQNAIYDTITPSLYRLKPEERIEYDWAFVWFHTAISAWHSSFFRYHDGELDEGGVEHEAAIGVAQHYQLATFLVDWSWDPLVAMAFAISGLQEGEKGAVYLRNFGKGLDQNNNVLLPPLFAKRVWRQRGFFSWHPVSPEDWDDHIVNMIDGGRHRFLGAASNYHRVVFPVGRADIFWAREKYKELMAEETPRLSHLSKWCLQAIRQGASQINPFCAQYTTLERFAYLCTKDDLDLPEIFSAQDKCEAGEDITLTMDYLDQLALRRHPVNKRLMYYLPHLVTACVGMPWKTWTKQRDGEAAIREDKRAHIFFTKGRNTLDFWYEELRKMNMLATQFNDSDAQRLREQKMFIDRPE